MARKSQLEIDISANTKGSVEALKAVQSNINKVADLIAKLEREGTSFGNMTNGVAELEALMSRLASAMVNSGEAADYSSAMFEVVNKALASVNKVYKGEFSEIAAHLMTMYDNAKISAEGINAIIEMEEQLKAQADAVTKAEEAFLNVLSDTEAKRNIDELTVAQQKQYDALKETYELEQERLRIQNADGDSYLKKQEELADYTEKLGQRVAEATIKKYEDIEHAKKQALYDDLFGNDKLEKATALYSKNAKEAMNAASANSQLAKSISNVGSAASSSSSPISSWVKKLGSTFKNIVLFRSVMTFTNTVVNGIKNTIKDSIQAAAEAEQVFAKLTTVFGEYSDAVNVANSLSSKLGTSVSTTASALSTVGDMLQAQGMGIESSLSKASKWVKDFSDIIAFKDINMSLEEFAQNFMSGTSGNLRNFRTFGSIVKESAVQARLMQQGLDKLTGSELELAKMTARAEIALEQQKNAMEATEREWDTTLSIQRRYEESFKGFKEMLGESLTGPVNLWRKTWTNILDDVSKTYKVLKEMKKLDPKDVSSDFVDTSSSAFGTAMERSYGKNLVSETFFSDELEKVFRMFNTDVAHVMSWYTMKTGNLQGTSEYEEMNKIAEDIYELLQQKLGTEAAEKERNSRNLQIAEGLDSLFENLQTLKYVNFHNQDWYKTYNAQSELFSDEALRNGSIAIGKSSYLSGALGGAVELLSASLDQALGESKFGENGFLDKLFGDFDKGKTLEETAGLLKDMYKIMYTSGEYTEDQLDVIVNKWKSVNSELEEYNAEQEKAKKLAAILSSETIGGTDYVKSMSDLYSTSNWEVFGYESEEHASAVLKLQRSIAEAQSLAVKDSKEWLEIQTRGENELKLQKEYYKQIATLSKVADNKVKHDEKISSSVEGRTGYEYQLATLGMDDTQKTLYDFNIRLKEAAEALDKDLYESIMKEKKAFNELQEATKEYDEKQRRKQTKEDALKGLKDQWGSIKDLWSVGGGILKGAWDGIKKAGPIGGTIGSNILHNTPWFVSAPVGAPTAVASLGTSLVAGGVTGAVKGAIGAEGFWDMMTEIASQTKAFQKLTSIVSDYIVPVIDAFLEPLLPIIDMIGKFIQDDLMAFLEWFYPVLNIVAMAVAGIVGIVEAVSRLIADSFRWLIGNIWTGFYKIIDAILWGDQSAPNWAKQWADIDVWGNFQKALEDTAETVKKIEGNTFEIKENTDTTDLSFLDELLAAQIIDEAAYNSRVKAKQSGLNWDTVGASTSGYVSAQRHTTEVQAGAIVININGANDSTEVQRQVYRALQVAGIPVSGQSI